MPLAQLSNRIRVDAQFAKSFMEARRAVVQTHRSGKRRVRPSSGKPGSTALEHRVMAVMDPRYKDFFEHDVNPHHKLVTINGVKFYVVPSGELGALARKFELYTGGRPDETLGVVEMGTIPIQTEESLCKL